ncbi:SDR family NAD(P)-dependent oxidoreductase [Skermania sp. ID1734]|uniref:SDR family NAD(P)-dependent oxidoreductase n=1 Tax=Skermania sp. ID1734 TaxID=2597516 RepID=UPI00117D296F|nr:SDR family NAD(P)-dependent oxidoreductase [Skermania sp. ID1734]TSE01015.1 SDR family NAD(P)-dependent oxidoreductase [Skermania sp. ID1734]
MSTPQTVLITGAAGGLGTATTERFVRSGWTVFAADLTPPPAANNVVPIQLNVTHTESVDVAANRIAELSPAGLGALVTLAGVLDIGPLAEMPDDRLQRVIDINVMGTHRSVRACFPLLRKGNGRVILISSETGWQHAMPFNGAYALTKHAVEAYGDALRRELAAVRMPVSIVEPGPFRTSMTASIEDAFARATPPDSPFAAMARKSGRMARKEHATASEPALLADTIFAAATAPRPRIRYSVKPNRARAVLDKLPVPVVDAVLRRAL